MSDKEEPSLDASARRALALPVSRRQMLAGAAVGLASLALPLTGLSGLKPREAQAWVGNATWLEDGRAYLIAAEANTDYLLVPRDKSSSSYIYVRTEHKSTVGSRMFWYVENTGNWEGHQYWLRNFITGLYLDRYANNYYDGGKVGVSGCNKSVDYQKFWLDHCENDSIAIIGVGESTGVVKDSLAVDTTGSLGSNVHLWDQSYEEHWQGSTNVNQRYIFYHADYYLDINPDDNKYGNSYSEGARVKSYDIKVALDGKQTYKATGVSDYNRRDLVTCTYYITNVKYRDGYVYKDCKLSAGTLVSKASDGTSFTIKHSVWQDISFSINTKESITMPPAPSKSAKITS